MFKILKLLSILAIAAAILQCSGNSNSTASKAAAGTVPGVITVAPAEATSVSAKITADSGGQLSIGNSIQLTVPAGALDKDTLITVDKSTSAQAQGNVVPVTNKIELGTHGIEFSKPVTLNVCYDSQKMAQQNLKEETLAVYFVDPVSGEYLSVGGTVNKATHCVTAGLQHFSTYLVAAQYLASFGNQQPAIPGVSLLPTEPIAALPLKITAIVTDFELPATGPVGFGQIATVRLCYFVTPATSCVTPVTMTPDYDDDTSIRYSYVIPANQIANNQTVFYSVTATDNLGLQRTRSFSRAINRAVSTFFILNDAPVDLTAGFKRSFTLRATTDFPGDVVRNVVFDTFSLSGGIGTAVKTTPSVVQVTATTSDPQTFRPGNLTFNAGTYSVTSQVIRVHAGLLDHISLLSPAGVVLGNSININSGATYDFDVLGYDAYGNTSYVLPTLSLAPNPFVLPPENPGTIGLTGLYTAPVVTVARVLTLTANLNGVQDQIVINVDAPAPISGLIGEPDPDFGSSPVPGAVDFPSLPVVGAPGSAGVVIDASDNIYFTGYIFDTNSNRHMIVSKYDASTKTASLLFTESAFTTSEGYGIALDAYGKLVVSGKSDDGTGDRATVWRMSTAGALDTTPPSFGSGGVFRLAIPGGSSSTDLAISASGNIVVTAKSSDLIVFQLDNDGVLVGSFGTSGIVTLPVISPGLSDNKAIKPLISSTGEIFIMGSLVGLDSQADGAIWKLDATGQLMTTTFNAPLGYMTFGTTNIYDTFSDMKIDPTGRILALGYRFPGTGADSFIIAVDQTDGSLVSTGLSAFGNSGSLYLGSPGMDTYGLGLNLDSAGRAIITGGVWNQPSGPLQACAWRLTTAGQLDPAFGGGDGQGCFTTVPGFAAKTVLDSQGRIMAATQVQPGNLGYTEATILMLRFR